MQNIFGGLWLALQMARRCICSFQCKRPHEFWGRRLQIVSWFRQLAITVELSHAERHMPCICKIFHTQTAMHSDIYDYSSNGAMSMQPSGCTMGIRWLGLTQPFLQVFQVVFGPVLSDGMLTVLGTVKPANVPAVVVTSSKTFLVLGSVA
jgi:hypothetical protein